MVVLFVLFFFCPADVHVNIVSDEVMRAVGGQCKVWRNVMMLWHLVQIDSRFNRQTDRETRTDRPTDRHTQDPQTDRAGSGPAFSSMASGLGGGGGVRLLCGRFSGWSPPVASPPTCDRGVFCGGARRSLPRWNQPPQAERKKQQEPRG